MRRPVVVAAQEVAVVGAALACVLLSHPTGFSWSEPAAIVACLALPLRLRWPWLAMVCCLWALTGELGLAPALVGLYRIGRTARTPWVTGAWAFAAVVATETTVFALTPLSPRDGTLSVLFTILWMLSPSALGMLVTTRQRLAASVRDLKQAKEAEFEARADRARTAERARISREIHDAVGHHATLIAVEAAALEATSEEPTTKAAADRIRGLAKESLAEMREALGLVGESPHGLPDVPALVAEARAAGMRVELRIPSDVPVPPAVSRAAYRIVQESVTNAAKHAPDSPVSIEVRTGARLMITITTEHQGNPPPTDTAGGHGLPGMAERAAMVGGTLTADRDTDGSFTVRARLPLQSDTQAKVDQGDPTIDGSQRAVDVR